MFAAKHEHSEVYCLNFVEVVDVQLLQSTDGVSGYVPWL